MHAWLRLLFYICMYTHTLRHHVPAETLCHDWFPTQWSLQVNIADEVCVREGLITDTHTHTHAHTHIHTLVIKTPPYSDIPLKAQDVGGGEYWYFLYNPIFTPSGCVEWVEMVCLSVFALVLSERTKQLCWGVCVCVCVCSVVWWEEGGTWELFSLLLLPLPHTHTRAHGCITPTHFRAPSYLNTFA